ncbi:hypothetical protein Tco_0328350 [Tanacetum coccineum]
MADQACANLAIRDGAFSSPLVSISDQGVWWDIIKADRTIDSVDVAYKNSVSLKFLTAYLLPFGEMSDVLTVLALWTYIQGYELEDEYISQCLASCPLVIPIWRKVWAWWGLALPVSFPSFSISDISLGNLGFPNNPLLSKVLIGVVQCAFWGVWKWRNKVVNASDEDLNDAKNEDIFLLFKGYRSFGSLLDIQSVGNGRDVGKNSQKVMPRQQIA